MFETIAIFANIAKGWITGLQKLQQAKQDRELAAIQNQAKLLADKEAYNSAWEMAALQDSDRWLKRISFTIFSLPFICAIFDPSDVATYFRVALASIPDWYVKTYIGIVGSVWGIASLKNTIPTIVNQIRSS